MPGDLKPAIPAARACALAVLLVLGAVLTGCAGHSARTEEARSALDAMQPKTALALLNEELEVDSAEEVPEEVEGDNALLILDRAMVLQQLDDYELSSRDLQVADKAVEILDFSRNALDDIGKYMFSDATGPYKAPAYEKLMINTMNMINYLVRGDLNGARVEARRLAVMQKYLKDHEDPAIALLGPGSYLAGFIFEKSGRSQEALRYYDEALQYGWYRSLQEPVRRLAARASYRSPRIRHILRGTRPPAPQGDSKPKGKPPASKKKPPPAPQDGSKPDSQPPASDQNKPPPKRKDDSKPEGQQKQPTKSDHETADDEAVARFDEAATSQDEPSAQQGRDKGKGQASAAREEKTDKQKQRRAPPPAKPDRTGELLAIVNFGRVPAKYAKRIPIGLALTYAAGFMSPADRARANHLALQGLVTWINYPELGKPRGTYSQPLFAVGRRWQYLEGILAVDREAKRAWDEAKGAVVASAITRMITRVVAGEGARKATGGGAVGLLVSLGTQATMTVVDTPDTRSWSTLPARMAFGRVRLRPGTYWVTLGARGVRKRQRVTIRPGGWSVVNLTVLH